MALSLKVLHSPWTYFIIVIGLFSFSSAFMSSASSRVEIPFSASLEKMTSSSSRCSLSRTSHLSRVKRSSGVSSQKQSAEDDLFSAQEFGAQRSTENGSSSSRNYVSNEVGSEYAYSQQMQEYSPQTDFQNQMEYPHSSSPSRKTNYYASTSTAEGEYSSASAPSNNCQEPISSVDARVLESILKEGKLDLSTEAEVKRLLEGPRLQDDENSSGGEKDDRYNSRFVNTVADNAFWNSLKAKATEIIESVGIYIENRIERDAQTLTAVGLFTLDRIRRDIGRALPAAGRATRKLLLATNSSFAETLLDVTDRTPFALPAERSLTDREMMGDVYDELSTPADEIRQVTEAILEILSGKRMQSDSSSYTNSRRGVRSFAPAGTSKLAERQRRAYQARKQTVLKREKEGIDRKVGRALNSVTDTTWELRREMQTDAGREAGYRSKGVRNALAAGATRLLEASRENSRRLLSASERRRLLGSTEDNGTNIIDVSPSEEEEIIANVIEESNLEFAPDGLLSPQSFFEEKQRLIASLESCLSRPSETWLTKEIVAQATASGIMLDGTILREVIANMVALRDEIQKELDAIVTGQVDLRMAFVQTDLRRMKKLIDSVTSLATSAAGESAAYMLKQELEGFVLSDSLDDIIETELERMEQLLSEMVASREKAMQSQKQRYFMDSSVAVSELDDNKSREASARNARKYSNRFTEVEAILTPNRATISFEDMMDQGQDAYQTSSSVEVVSESEFSEYEQQFKYTQNYATGKEMDTDEVNEKNPTLDIVLRVMDVVFFIGEKAFLVLPYVIKASAKAFSRYADAQNRGRGSSGWKSLQNVKRNRR